MHARCCQERRRMLLVTASSAVWLVVVIGGFAVLANHSLSGGRQRRPPRHWPKTTAISRAATGASLLMFIHPDCPCTRASLGEVERLMAKHPDRLHVRLIVYDRVHSALQPQSFPVLSGVPAIVDIGGREARRFGAATSGQVVLYNADGELLFSGGITVARGHAGDSDGTDAINSILQGQNPAVRHTPVFGCSIDHQSSWKSRN